MSDPLGTWPHFRLNFEQQKKRAKELLKAARAGDSRALARFESHPPRLAEAQFLIARELRFENWAALKAHIDTMQHVREIMERKNVLDADLRTLHVRCGSDIRQSLQIAGLQGDFYEHSYPYLAGPVREGPDALAQRARFLVAAFSADRTPPLEYALVLAGLERDERLLHESAAYERVVIWSEHDCYDQLVLLRLLGHYATHRCPQRLELVNARDWPGAVRFIGIGQLPPEALRMLWSRREPVTTAQLSLGLAGWKALASDDPCGLADIMRSGTPALPLLAPALHRHLQELPCVRNGLALTQQMALSMLADGPRSLSQMFVRMNYLIDPLPGQGDLQMRDRVLPMGEVSEPLFTRQAGVDAAGNARPPWTDVLTITEIGRAVLRGELDFLSLRPAPRWVGGVQIGTGQRNWRWDEHRRQPSR